MTNKQENSREIVLDLLLSLEKEEGFSHTLIRQVLDKFDYLDNREKSFIKRLFEGTIERQLELDYLLNYYSSVKVTKMKPLIRNLLRMSLYQILYMDSVPDGAAVNEAVKLAAKRKFQNLKGFVNGILRKIIREKESLPYPDKDTQKELFLSVSTSTPMWIVEHFLKAYGQERTETLLKGMMEIKPITLRLSATLSKEEQEAWLLAVRERGVTVTPHPYLPYAYSLTDTENISYLPGYQEGAFVIQDVSSMLAVECANISVGDFVVDLCAAPGGKTMLAAEKTGPKGKVLARDVSEDKVEKIAENIARMGLTQVQVEVADGTVFSPQLEGMADVVLADVPCSGLGVMGRKRDIKYRLKEENLPSLYELQKQILSQAVRYVKPGGKLLYSTCTLNPAENQEMAQWICQQFDLQFVDLRSTLPAKLQQLEDAEKGYVQLFPGEQDCDGFFIAGFQKAQG